MPTKNEQYNTEKNRTPKQTRKDKQQHRHTKQHNSETTMTKRQNKRGQNNEA